MYVMPTSLSLSLSLSLYISVDTKKAKKRSVAATKDNKSTATPLDPLFYSPSKKDEYEDDHKLVARISPSEEDECILSSPEEDEYEDDRKPAAKVFSSSDGKDDT